MESGINYEEANPSRHRDEQVKPYPQNSYYIGNGWKAKFSCGCCGREIWQHLNFLGQRVLVCNGRKIAKVEKPDPEIEVYSTFGI